MIDIQKLAQKLIAELNVKEMIYKARAEGVALLYERIREQSEQSDQPGVPEAPEGQAK